MIHPDDRRYPLAPPPHPNLQAGVPFGSPASLFEADIHIHLIFSSISPTLFPKPKNE